MSAADILERDERRVPHGAMLCARVPIAHPGTRGESGRASDDEQFLSRDVEHKVFATAAGSAPRDCWSVAAAPRRPVHTAERSGGVMSEKRKIRVLHGGPIAREVRRPRFPPTPDPASPKIHQGADLIACADGTLPSPPQVADRVADVARPTHDVELFELADYPAAGFDLVNLRDAPAEPSSSASASASSDPVHVLVVETAEHENPADAAVTFIRDLLAANKKTRTVAENHWRLRINGEPTAAAPLYAVVAVGDVDCMPERAAFRSKQHAPSDCNQAGQLADKAFGECGGERVCARLEIDVARDEVESDVRRWFDGAFRPAVERAS